MEGTAGVGRRQGQAGPPDTEELDLAGLKVASGEVGDNCEAGQVRWGPMSVIGQKSCTLSCRQKEPAEGSETRRGGMCFRTINQ